MPGVRDCAVAGAPDEEWGEVPVVFVIPEAGASLRHIDVIDHCTGRLTAYKHPARTMVVDEIPRTGSGKVMRFRLAALHAAAELEAKARAKARKDPAAS